jgi:hypothetical protein
MVFALGACFFWPTMPGYVSEHFPRTGAVNAAARSRERITGLVR